MRHHVLCDRYGMEGWVPGRARRISRTVGTHLLALAAGMGVGTVVGVGIAAIAIAVQMWTIGF